MIQHQSAFHAVFGRTTVRPYTRGATLTGIWSCINGDHVVPTAPMRRISPQVYVLLGATLAAIWSCINGDHVVLPHLCAGF
ncbi:MAG: hypothetical protein K2G12_08080, partial [Prevotella sp.]|nr:hypothetical protein [Prevotella sp.]